MSLCGSGRLFAVADDYYAHPIAMAEVIGVLQQTVQKTRNMDRGGDRRHATAIILPLGATAVVTMRDCMHRIASAWKSLAARTIYNSS